MRPGPAEILPAYRREADAFAAARRTFRERAVFAALLRRMRGRRVIDLGCGTGWPVAAFLAGRGYRVTGVDGAAPMLARFQAQLPQARAVLADMRRLPALPRFDAVIAWDSFFHLAPRDQAAMVARFRRLCAPGGRVVLSTGPALGSVIGRVGASPVYHASLAPAQYRRLFARHGFHIEACRFRDPAAGGRSHWRLSCGSKPPRRRRRGPIGAKRP